MSPTERPGRTLILCFDGTGNKFTDENTNIVRLFSALEKAKPKQQLCYYQPGIGTYESSTVSWSPWRLQFSKLLDEAFAWYLDGHVMGGYRWLMNCWEPGDRICLFGFSRGAYTARCLAGMLSKVGLLPKENLEQISFAYKKYVDTRTGADERAAGFKAAFSREVTLDFVGVWDTVASVGFFSKHLPFTSSNHLIKTFRHALALDERRAKFKPNPWHRTAPDAAAAYHDPENGSHVQSIPRTPLERVKQFIETGVRDIEQHLRISHLHPKSHDRSKDESQDLCEGATDVREIWFAGCHSDVGGGSVGNNTKNSLANPSLQWMVNEILDPKYRLFILFKEAAFDDIQAFDTLVHTSKHPKPEVRHKGIPSVFLNHHNRPLIGIEEEVSHVPESPDAVEAEVEPPRLWYQPESSPASFRPISPIETDPAPETTAAESPCDQPEGDPDKEVLVAVSQNSASSDAEAPSFDSLVRKPIWWIVEFMWFPERWQDAHGVWHKRWRPNLGAPREIRDPKPLFHSSVRMRVAKGYKPRAVLTSPGAEPEYVDQ